MNFTEATKAVYYNGFGITLASQPKWYIKYDLSEGNLKVYNKISNQIIDFDYHWSMTDTQVNWIIVDKKLYHCKFKIHFLYNKKIISVEFDSIIELLKKLNDLKIDEDEMDFYEARKYAIIDKKPMASLESVLDVTHAYLSRYDKKYHGYLQILDVDEVRDCYEDFYSEVGSDDFEEWLADKIGWISSDEEDEDENI